MENITSLITKAVKAIPTEKDAISFVSKIAPWLTTIPQSFSIGHAVYFVIGWPAVIAIITALAIETMGIGVTNTALELYAYNRSKRKSDPTAPLWLGVALVVIYYGATIILTAVLEGNAVLALFPALSAVAAGTLALRADQAARVATIEAERSERRKPAQPAPQPVAEVAVKKYTCAVCAQSYEKQTSLAAHMRSHKVERNKENVS